MAPGGGPAEVALAVVALVDPVAWPGGGGGVEAAVAAVAALAAVAEGRGGMSNTGRKYSLTFSAQALNLFNDIDYGTPTGSVVPTLISGSGATAMTAREPV